MATLEPVAALPFVPCSSSGRGWQSWFSASNGQRECDPLAESHGPSLFEKLMAVALRSWRPMAKWAIGGRRRERELGQHQPDPVVWQRAEPVKVCAWLARTFSAEVSRASRRHWAAGFIVVLGLAPCLKLVRWHGSPGTTLSGWPDGDWATRPASPAADPACPAFVALCVQVSGCNRSWFWLFLLVVEVLLLLLLSRIILFLFRRRSG